MKRKVEKKEQMGSEKQIREECRCKRENKGNHVKKKYTEDEKKKEKTEKWNKGRRGTERVREKGMIEHHRQSDGDGTREKKTKVEKMEMDE